MFFFGNIIEKFRVVSLFCVGEVLVDFYVGIGYFILSFLVYVGVVFVYVCEWNFYVVVVLRNNFEINGVVY